MVVETRLDLDGSHAVLLAVILPPKPLEGKCFRRRFHRSPVRSIRLMGAAYRAGWRAGIFRWIGRLGSGGVCLLKSGGLLRSCRQVTLALYVNWARRFILFHDKRHPAEMGKCEVEAFLT